MCVLTLKDLSRGRSSDIPVAPAERAHELSKITNRSGRRAKVAKGLEQTFDDQLRGKPGQLNLTFDKDGNKSGERIAVQPEPGYNVVTTLDVDMQRLAEKILQKRAKRGAIVVMDPNTGEVLALASWPTIDPNDFVPTISEEKFKKIASDPNIPMLPRAYRSAYPPGSTFKMFVGVAGFETHAIDPKDEFDCPSALEVGNIVFRNWKKTDAGDLNFRQALDAVVQYLVLPGRSKDRIAGLVDLGQAIWIGCAHRDSFERRSRRQNPYG